MANIVINRFTLPSIAGPKLREAMREAAREFASSIGKEAADVRAEVFLTGGVDGIKNKGNRSTVQVRLRLYGVHSGGDEFPIRTTYRVLEIIRND